MVRSRSIPSIAALGLLLLAIFAAWIAAAQLLYTMLFGPTPPTSLVDFLGDVVSTERGWMLIQRRLFHWILFCRRDALAVSVVSFPLLLDRDIDAAMAVASSIEAVRENSQSRWRFGAS